MKDMDSDAEVCVDMNEPLCYHKSPCGWECTLPQNHLGCHIRHGYADTIIEAWIDNKTLSSEEFFKLYNK